MSNFKWGTKSLNFLTTRMHPTVKDFMDNVLKVSQVDISVIDGARDKYMQRQLFIDKKSELDGVNLISYHQVEKYSDNLARAIDVIPSSKTLNVWDVDKPEVSYLWLELYRALLRVDFEWKQRGIDVGLELGLAYNIAGGRDYPHISFTKI